MQKSIGIITLLVAGLHGPIAHAVDPPKFDYGKAADVKEVIWKASAQAGFVLTTGNSNTLTISGGALGSRDDGKNRLQLEVSGAYARSTVRTANDLNMNGTIDNRDEIGEESKTTAAQWLVKGRYDRFFTPNNALYLVGFASGDEPAGKQLVAGAQAGYARQLLKSERHLLSIELGLDYSYVNYVDVPNPAPTRVDEVHIASLRGFIGYTLTLSADTSLLAQVEVLDNLNPLTINKTEDFPDCDGVNPCKAGPFYDVRVLGKTALTTKLYKNISFRFSFTARFDNVAAPLPNPGLKFADGFVPAAQKLDTLTEAAIIVNFI